LEQMIRSFHKVQVKKRILKRKKRFYIKIISCLKLKVNKLLFFTVKPIYSKNDRIIHQISIDRFP